MAIPAKNWSSFLVDSIIWKLQRISGVIFRVKNWFSSMFCCWFSESDLLLPFLLKLQLVFSLCVAVPRYALAFVSMWGASMKTYNSSWRNWQMLILYCLISYLNLLYFILCFFYSSFLCVFIMSSVLHVCIKVWIWDFVWM